MLEQLVCWLVVQNSVLLLWLLLLGFQISSMNRKEGYLWIIDFYDWLVQRERKVFLCVHCILFAFPGLAWYSFLFSFSLLRFLFVIFLPLLWICSYSYRKDPNRMRLIPHWFLLRWFSIGFGSFKVKGSL